jgi:hypothetical protein
MMLEYNTDQKNAVRKNGGRNLDGQPNLDPVAGALGAHPVGAGVGAIGGAIAAGAAIGTVAGPVGIAAGVIVGAVAGGLAGKGVAEVIDPSIEETYWRENYESRPHVNQGDSFSDYGPAYRYGGDSYGRSEGLSFEQSEPELERNWESNKGSSMLDWDRARHASRDSWQRTSDAIEKAVPGDSDRDGM